ncbi:uncharacterized protein PFL1_02344 [Pseudozyma flocculosa PF-1]|uniref:Uncharacterized protein n=1 Tax=Pseudozyma flocculosa TaxID=84751 RepID=A0A5C3F6Q0_9BASI|nr:uncharacterized protein PFL1_02344 [Pseudozyma flocculosa PF-1]EPQ30228.1 hypothetical protein PFL1_02344 [Pseudozyma flocculosa PF-1]SPO39840.1 uncharacterized protein PSFLO_05321 [Pseudozyma flocculosa]
MLSWAPATAGVPNKRGPHADEDEDEVDEDLETYLLLLLSDSNLPTGGFVASSGLESYHAHGFLHNVETTSSLASFGVGATLSAGPGAGRRRQMAPSQARLSSSTLSYTRSTLHSYARSAVPFLVRAHQAVRRYCSRRVRIEVERYRRRRKRSDAEQDGTAAGEEAAERCYDAEADAADLEALMGTLAWLDQAYHTLLLNHVARRASRAQGIALLTLYTKAFARPINLEKEHFDGSRLGLRRRRGLDGTTNDGDDVQDDADDEDREELASRLRIEIAATLVEKLKREIRKSSAGASSTSRQQQGHFPLCWAVFSAALGLSRARTVQLHLFLQARSLLSSSIRLNTLGPYLAHQLMRFQLRDVVKQIVDELESEGCMDGQEEEEEHMEGESQGGEGLMDQDMEADNHIPAYRIDEPAAGQAQPAPPAVMVQALRPAERTLIPVDDSDPDQGWAWDWAEDELADSTDRGPRSAAAAAARAAATGPSFWQSRSAPATTFPLGEIVQARHDQLHSRLFNS